MSFSISKEIQFDAGHRVPNHASKCRNPHGHRYRVVVHLYGELVTTPGASDEGMLADFSVVKQALTTLIHDKFDHGFIVYSGDTVMADMFGLKFGKSPEDFKIITVDWIPTAENLAAYAYGVLSEELNSELFDVYKVDVWETPTSCASYEGE